MGALHFSHCYLSSQDVVASPHKVLVAEGELPTPEILAIGDKIRRRSGDAADKGDAESGDDTIHLRQHLEYELLSRYEARSRADNVPIMYRIEAP